MPNQQNPKEKSAHSAAKAPDEASPQPSGDEVFTAKGAPARPQRETERRYAPNSGDGQHAEADVTRLQLTATEYFDRLGSAAGDLTQQARQVYDSGQSFVRKHPAPTLGGAVLLGIVIGLLMGRD